MKAQANRMYEDVHFLSSIYPYRNYENTASLKQAANYIDREFRAAGLATHRQSWMARDRQYDNVIASFHPERKRKLVVGAHYDVHRNQPGADDNASGVAGLLESARLISELDPDIDYGIEFVAYCLEEPPFFETEFMGSFIHAKSLFDQEVPLIGMICYEMIGYYAGKPNRPEEMPHGIHVESPESRKFIGVVSIHKYADFHRYFYRSMSKYDNRVAAFVSFPDSSRPPTLSDNRNYWHFGYPALMLNDAASGRNPNYHQITDTIDTLDFAMMQK